MYKTKRRVSVITVLTDLTEIKMISDMKEFFDFQNESDKSFFTCEK